MRKNMKWVTAVMFAAVVSTGLAALLTAPPASAAGSRCWQVECNTCCKSGGGPVVCTQRACV